MEPPLELRQLRYFVAVAEELHFGRAAARLHMSQSPLSRAIRELERDAGLVLFLRTTRRVELTPAGEALLAGARTALAAVGEALAEARRAAGHGDDALVVGHGPLSRAAAGRIAAALAPRAPGRAVRLEEDLSSELVRKVAGRELAAAVVLALPPAARRPGVRTEPLPGEPLLAALPAGHPRAGDAALPAAAFAAERVLLPREPVGAPFNAWLRAALRLAGAELGRTVETLSAPWDHRMLPVAEGGAASVLVADWLPVAGVAALPFEPPLALPLELAVPDPPVADDALVRAAAAAARD